MSSGVACSTWRGQASQAASTSRCVCTTALGLPVVPEVKAIRAMSSPAVGQGANGPVWAAAKLASVTCPGAPLSNTMRCSPGCWACASCNSSTKLAAHKATLGCAFSMISPSSLERNMGMLATATRPAFTAASQASTMSIELPPRSNTRLPGTKPRSPVSTCAIWSTCARTWA